MASKVDYPEDLRYTKEHEWLRVEGDGLVRVGITDYAQDQLGDVASYAGMDAFFNLRRT